VSGKAELKRPPSEPNKKWSLNIKSDCIVAPALFIIGVRYQE